MHVPESGTESTSTPAAHAPRAGRVPAQPIASPRSERPESVQVDAKKAGQVHIHNRLYVFTCTAPTENAAALSGLSSRS
eukprot:6594418-Prymnesium_polylepis.1